VMRSLLDDLQTPKEFDAGTRHSGPGAPHESLTH
jgi:hypothetical protein